MMQNRIKLIAYWLYLWAVFCLATVFWSSGVFDIVISLLFTGLFYQAGTGIRKERNRDRKIAIGLLLFLALGNVDTFISALGATTNIGYTLLFVILSLVIIVVSGISTYYLFTKNVAGAFKNENNA